MFVGGDGPLLPALSCLNLRVMQGAVFEKNQCLCGR